jgi:hypothetical protein
MRRWDLIAPDVNLPDLVTQVYRPDLYRSAVDPLGEPAPLADSKIEGSHPETWSTEASVSPISMRPDTFCDGAVFDPESIALPSRSTFDALHKI